jgi:phenylalanyl-tRNA synthetase alpha chain
MTAPDTLREAAAGAEVAIAEAESIIELDRIEDEYLGPKSTVTVARRSLRGADEETRRELGRAVHEVSTHLAALVAERRATLERFDTDGRLASESLDLTLPGRVPPRGTVHAVHAMWDEIVDIFVSLGYAVASGPEAETAYHNFDALNTPPWHPARLESDTLYLEYGDDPEGILLRTQTSPVQVRWLEENPTPVYVVAPGRVYRRDPLDATHSPVFHQMEGLAVDQQLSFADLKGTLQHFIEALYGIGRRIRFLPHFFPFTEPSAELFMSCHRCDGSGCRTCGNTGWIELLGCGVVDPYVLSAAGHDPDEVSGFAFGVGIDRLAMARYGIAEIRHLWDADLRVLEQFR